MRVESDKAEKIDLGKLETDAYVLTLEFIEKAKLKAGQLPAIPLRRLCFRESTERQRRKRSFFAHSAVST